MKTNIDFDRKHQIQVGDEGVVKFRLRDIVAKPGKQIRLDRDFDPDFSGGFTDKSGAIEHVADNVERLADLQSKLYAQDVHAVLIILQAMDAAGKDGAIRHVMSGVNPQGVHVTSFKAPSAEELDHDYLWRAARALPGRGMIGIFNRSYYEEVLVVRVHPELLERQKLPRKSRGPGIWKHRFKEINNFEKYLFKNGIVVIKFFLNISYEEQRKRFISRIDEPEKNWKFSTADSKERAHWDEYQKAIQEMLKATSTVSAPWFVIPANKKWFSRLAISEVICGHLERLDLKFPAVTDERRAELQDIRKHLEAD